MCWEESVSPILYPPQVGLCTAYTYCLFSLSFFFGEDDKHVKKKSVLLPLLYVMVHFFLSHDTSNLLYFFLGSQRITWKRTGFLGYSSLKAGFWSSGSDLSKSSTTPKVKCSKVLSWKYLRVAWNLQISNRCLEDMASFSREKEKEIEEWTVLFEWVIWKSDSIKCLVASKEQLYVGIIKEVKKNKNKG